MRTIQAYGAVSATDPLESMTVERRDVGPRDVRIDIEYAGICHSDLHTVRSEWSAVAYPLVPGHEIVGRVAQVGDEVTKHRVGDTVGVGCMVGSCMKCVHCKAGKEQRCLEGSIATYGGVDIDGTNTQGGYSQAVVVDEHFVLGIPEGMDPARTAPLLCAGITTYSPLRFWNVGPGTRLGVIGLGGLGHMAVQIAAALGAEVTVLTRGTAKKGDALRLGATSVIDTTDIASLRSHANSFDVIINSVSAPLKMGSYLRLLDVEGVMVFLGAPPEPISLNAFSLIISQRSITGSQIGGIPETQEMLEFCADHGIHAEIELISAEEINAAYERMLAGDVRYRFVIDTATL